MTRGKSYKFAPLNQSIIRSLWENGHNFVLENLNQSDLWHSKENSEGYFSAKFQILKIHNHRDNTISISSSSKQVKGVYFFSELHKSCLKNQVELIERAYCRIYINIGF